MRFSTLQKSRFAKFLAVAAIAAVLLSATPAYAEDPAGDSACSWLSVSTWPQCFILGIGTILLFVLKAIILLVGLLVEIVLAANQNIVNTPAVQIGFGVTLAVANLGFVLGIIVIAIATILRRETYGVKQLLWKLILMAILVNFGLVIANAVITFANQLTLYFMDAASGGSAGALGQTLAAIFAPQKLTSGSGPGGAAGLAEQLGVGTAAIFAQITALFTAIFLILIALITMLAAAIMLLIRYVALGLLLILLPLAWVSWVFPTLHGNWTKWWQSFLRWALFAPVLMFFIYLAIKTWEGSSDFLTKVLLKDIKSDPASAALGIEQSAFGKFFTTLVELLGQQVIIVGLMLGGLFAANSLSITGAKAAYGAAEGTLKGFGGWAGRKTGGVFARAATQTRPPPAASTWMKAKYWMKSPLRGAAKAVPAGPRAAMGVWGHRMATSPGLASSVVTGAAVGSGYYKIQQNWQCQYCLNSTPSRNTVVPMRGRPADDFVCPVCSESAASRRTALGAAGATYQNWVRVL